MTPAEYDSWMKQGRRRRKSGGGPSWAGLILGIIGCSLLAAVLGYLVGTRLRRRKQRPQQFSTAGVLGGPAVTQSNVVSVGSAGNAVVVGMPLQGEGGSPASVVKAPTSMGRSET